LTCTALNILWLFFRDENEELGPWGDDEGIDREERPANVEAAGTKRCWKLTFLLQSREDPGI
jgi:hypothetical protein